MDESLSKKYNQYSGNILFHISSRIKENQYSKENFLELIKNLENENILISAEPSDIDNAKWIEENSKATFIQTKSFSDLCGLIKNVKLFVTLDGGAMHIAPALGIKTISISGKTNMDKWYPWGYRNLVIQTETKIANDNDVEKILEKINKNI